LYKFGLTKAKEFPTGTGFQYHKAVAMNQIWINTGKYYINTSSFVIFLAPGMSKRLMRVLNSKKEVLYLFINYWHLVP
jgi:hypothetical protein